MIIYRLGEIVDVTYKNGQVKTHCIVHIDSTDGYLSVQSTAAKQSDDGSWELNILVGGIEHKRLSKSQEIILTGDQIISGFRQHFRNSLIALSELGGEIDKPEELTDSDLDEMINMPVIIEHLNTSLESTDIQES